jgi:hypothetical protein
MGITPSRLDLHRIVWDWHGPEHAAIEEIVGLPRLIQVAWIEVVDLR